MPTVQIYPHKDAVGYPSGTSLTTNANVWAAARADTNVNNDLFRHRAELFSNFNLDGWDNFIRSVVSFDTSILPANAIINSADIVFTIEPEAASPPYTTMVDDAVALVDASTIIGPESVHASFNHGAIGTSLLAATVLPAGNNEGGTRQFILNATGLAYFSKGPGAITKFGLRTESDRINVSNYSPAKRVGIMFYANDPINLRPQNLWPVMTVDYSLPTPVYIPALSGESFSRMNRLNWV